MTAQQKALSLIERCPIGVFSNLDAQGAPQMKAMFKTRNEGLSVFWFCSNTSSRRAGQITADGRASLYFYEFDPSAPNPCKGAMLSGVAEVRYDDDVRRAVWEPGMEIYYPKGPLDPDFALIRFTAVSGNYYEGLVNEDFDVDG